MLLHNHNTGNFMFYPKEPFHYSKGPFFFSKWCTCAQMSSKMLFVSFETQTRPTEVAWEMHFQPVWDTQLSKFSGEHFLRLQGSTSSKRLKKVQGCSCQTYEYDPRVWVPISSLFTDSPAWFNFHFWETTDIALFMLIRNINLMLFESQK